MDQILCENTNPVFDASSSAPIGFGSSTCQIVHATSSASSTIPNVFYGFTYGELVSSVFLFLIFSVLAFGRLWDIIFKR